MLALWCVFEYMANHIPPTTPVGSFAAYLQAHHFFKLHGLAAAYFNFITPFQLQQ